MTQDWNNLLEGEFSKEYFFKIQDFLRKKRKIATIFPPEKQIFSAFDLTSFEDTCVVILGQDTYHQLNQANGLAFSVNENVKIPPSLRNIFKEIFNEFGFDMPTHGNLTHWALQGVLMLNATLTVEENKANSHQKIGWDIFTNYIIRLLNDKNTPIVFMLWGNNAKQNVKYITNPLHLVLTSAHPSPLSAYNGFFGNNHFKLANEFLEKNNMKPIDWKI